MNTNYVIRKKEYYYIMKYSNWKTILNNYVKKNYKEYIIVTVLFIIGIFIGVMIINSSQENQVNEISTYINEIITKYKELNNINKFELVIKSIKRNLLFAIVIWSAGTTVIGIPIVLIMILIRGIVLGFTISSIIITLGTLKGILFCMIALVLQNIIHIPAILTIGTSSIKLYKSIIKDKRKENIKIELIRHTIICILMIVLLILSEIIENYISFKLIKKMIKYF